MKPAFPLQKNTPSTYLYRSYEAVSPDNFLARCGKAKVIAWPINFTLIFTLTKRIQQLASRICSLQLTALFQPPCARHPDEVPAASFRLIATRYRIINYD